MKKARMNLLLFEGIPQEAMQYLSNYGFHFNKKACDYAVSLMGKKDPTSGKVTPITPKTKDEVDDMLHQHSVKLENDCMYDATYVANMLMADKYKSSIPDEAHLALGIKDVIDDIDQRDGFIFVQWYCTCMFNGQPIDWQSLI